MEKAFDADFSVERCGFFNSLLFMPISVIRLASRLKDRRENLERPKHQRLEQVSTSPWINCLLSRMFVSESHLVNKLRLRDYFPWGISLMAVLVKR